MADSAVDKRPLSPHLQIWRFTPTMAASITHRGTGVALYVGNILLALWALSLVVSPALFAPFSALIASPVGTVIFFLYAWALIFHLIGGLRYLYYDRGRGMAPKTATMMAIVNYLLAFVLAGAMVFARIS